MKTVHGRDRESGHETTATGMETDAITENLDSIFSIVKAKTGHDFSSYKSNTIMRRIKRRMAVNGASGISKYIALLREDNQEAHALCKDILIGVTSFFRDSEAFAALRGEVIPRLFANRLPGEPVRIWHACCASGEEVYSMAMLLKEYLDERSESADVLIFATDIDEVAIAQARSGLYGDDIENDVGTERLNTFFTRSAGRWQVKKLLREMVVFAHHSLIKDPPFSRLDLLVCRNFLIYLKPDRQRRLIELFHQVLKPGAVLFLGAAETVGRGGEQFAAIDKKWKLFERLKGERRPMAPFPFTTAAHKQTGAKRSRKSAEAVETGPGMIAEKLLMERYAPPCVVVNEKYEVVHVSTRMGHFLEVPLGEPTRDILQMAREELRPALRAAIYKAFAEQQKVEFRGVKLVEESTEVTVNVVVEPLHAPGMPGKLAMVVFEPLVALQLPETSTGASGTITGVNTSRDMLVRQLEEQLRATHEQLQATSEQLETSNEGFLSANEELMSINEEFQSANEELQSTNEELETSKEELQALNEELVTVNAELQGKVEELNQATSDMENLLASSGIATIFLDRQLNIRGFTPAAAAIFNLIRSDISRSFRLFAGKIDWPSFAQDAETVLAGHPFAEREVASLNKELCYLKRIFPYQTQEGKIDGIVVIFIDITERKRADETLREAEERVRLKLESILSPEGDIGSIELADIIDSQALQSLMDDFFQLSKFPMAIIDINGKVLVGVGWQEICLKFHRIHPETFIHCIECDTQLTTGIPPGEFKLYKCKNNMWDVATPIMVGGRHLGNLFSGQFFFEDEPLDYEVFKEQARQYGFNEDEYIASLERVQRLNREQLATGMAYLSKFADIISKLSYSNIKLARSLAGQDSLVEALHESDERYQLATVVAKEAIWDLNITTGLVQWNRAYAEMFDRPEEAVSHNQWWVEQLHPEERERVTSSFAEALTEGRDSWTCDYRMRVPDGSYAYLTDRAIIVRNAEGAPLRVVGAKLNITEQRLAEEELRRAHDELELRVSERTEELDASISILRDEIGDRKRAEASLLRLNRLYAVLSEIDQAIIRASNRDTMFSDFCHIAVEQGGFLLSWVGLMSEETSGIQVVAACGATSYLDDIRISVNTEPTGSGPTGISIHEGTYHISNDFLNDPCTRTWHDKARLHGIRASASVAIKEEGWVIGALTLYAGEKDFFDQQQVELLVQMGADISFALDNLARETRSHLAEQALREETLERLRVVEALREQEQMLLQQSRLAAMGEMVNNIAHQWRQPLNVLGLRVQQMRLVYDVGSFSKEYLDASVTKSMGLINHMSQTIDDFRNFFKPDKEKVEFTLHEAVTRAVALVEDGFKSQQIGIDIHAGANPAVFGFANEYSQVLLNILMNARDAFLERHPDCAMVTITITGEDGRGIVTISDNAGGIPEEIIGKIFEPYFTTKGPDKGTGVGLFMSKNIIEKNMNGRLTVRNTAEGAEFRIEV